MEPLDAARTKFMSNHGNYYNSIMPFGIKNAADTYKRLMDAVFLDQIRCNKEVYINDIIMKTLEEGSLYKDLEDILKSF